MDTTIQYKGELYSADAIDRIYKKFKKIAIACKWDFKFLDDELCELIISGNREGASVPHEKGNPQLSGIRLSIFNDYELNILFCDAMERLRNPGVKNYFVSGSNMSYITVRTKFPPKNMHITVVKLLEYLRENYYNTLEVVSD